MKHNDPHSVTQDTEALPHLRRARAILRSRAQDPMRFRKRTDLTATALKHVDDAIAVLWGSDAKENERG